MFDVFGRAMDRTPEGELQYSTQHLMTEHLALLALLVDKGIVTGEEIDQHRKNVVEIMERAVAQKKQEGAMARQ